MGFFNWFRKGKNEENKDRDKKPIVPHVKQEQIIKQKPTVPPVKQEQIIKPIEIRLNFLDNTVIDTMYGRTNVYYDKSGDRALYIQTERPLPAGETIIPIIDSAKQVQGYYVVKRGRARSRHSGKELYFFEKFVEWHKMTDEDKARVMELARKLGIDVALPYSNGETVVQNGLTSPVEAFKSSVECAKVYPLNDGRQLADVIGKITNISKYVRTSQIMLLNTADSKEYVLIFGDYATIIDKVGIVVAEELPVDMAKQMNVQVTYGNKSKNATVLPLKKNNKS